MSHMPTKPIPSSGWAFFLTAHAPTSPAVVKTFLYEGAEVAALESDAGRTCRAPAEQAFHADPAGVGSAIYFWRESCCISGAHVEKTQCTGFIAVLARANQFQARALTRLSNSPLKRSLPILPNAGNTLRGLAEPSEWSSAAIPPPAGLRRRLSTS